jgi:hypothetical protein
MQVGRSTLIVDGKMAVRAARLSAAQERRHGLQIMTFEQAAVRLAGGFTRPINEDTLRDAIQSVMPWTDMGELEGIKGLPGMIGAAADTLMKAWRAGVDFSARAASHPRIEAVAKLEAAVVASLPTGMHRPCDIVAAAQTRIEHAAAILGPIRLAGISDLHPCWRPLVNALAEKVPVLWEAGPRAVPAWLSCEVEINASPAAEPRTSLISGATAYHEAVEAMRWARGLLASGVAAQDIAIAAASTAEFDDHFLALRADANIDLHFVHGISVLVTRDGQAAAALADIVVRGISQTRMRRLASLCRDSGPLAKLPDGWLRVLPSDAPMSTPGAWHRLLSDLDAVDWPDAVDHAQELAEAVDLLVGGAGAAQAIGETFLTGRARTIWRKALVAGPAASIDVTLESLRQDDGLEATVSAAWMPASELAASPRAYVRLVGLNSARWPRGISEDRLIPEHVIPTSELEPLPLAMIDRRDFETILATTSAQVVLSRARRDSEGRLLGRSPLLRLGDHETFLRRNAIPANAFSEADRLLARPDEFSAEAQAAAAQRCWNNWRRNGITAHDGLVRPNHPIIIEALGRTQSASSLKSLLRNPLGFVWKYAFGWTEPQNSDEPLVLDQLRNGNLVHAILDYALRDLESVGGLAAADRDQIAGAISTASGIVAAQWERSVAIPPHAIWQRTLDEARRLSAAALGTGGQHRPGTRSYGEVAFGGAKPRSGAALPWDAATPVVIPGTDIGIKGYIDRLDVSGDGNYALVRDYKTGKAPSGAIRLKGGSELQRCLYAFAVRQLLGEDVEITASLLYPREMLDLRLEDPVGTLDELARYLMVSRASLIGGAALPGPDTGGDYDDLAFALPANAGATYCKRKKAAVADRLGDATVVWEAK